MRKARYCPNTNIKYDENCLINKTRQNCLYNKQYCIVVVSANMRPFFISVFQPKCRHIGGLPFTQRL